MDAAMRALVLVLALSHSWAAVTTNDCEQIKPRRLSADNLDRISGDWVLVLGAFGSSDAIVGSLKSIHLELSLQPNASSMGFTERVKFIHGLCWKYNTHLNVTADSENTFHTFNSSVEERGVAQPLSEVSKMVFYESCENCLVLEYNGITGHVLFSAWREGHHQNIENLSKAQAKHDKLANCLGIIGENNYVYDGVSDLCPKTSS